jgi:uncharacterized protein (TIGR00369 family)
MSQMQQIEAAVGDGEFFSFGSQGRAPGGQVLPGNNFVPKIHEAIVPNLRRVWQTNFLLAQSRFCAQVFHMQPLPHTRSCFVCGEANPLGFKMRFETDGKIVRAQFIPRIEHVGFKGVVHGGIIATVLDEIMVWACAVQVKRFAFCAEMNVRYLNPMSPGTEVVVTGELVANRKNRIFEARGIAEANGLRLAESTGKYLPVKGASGSSMVTDFVGNADWLLGEMKSTTSPAD